MTDSGGKKRASRAGGEASPSESPFDSMITETVSLFHPLDVVAEHIHHRRDEGGNTRASRGGGEASPSESPFDSMITETVSLFHRLRVVADQIHHRGEM